MGLFSATGNLALRAVVARPTPTGRIVVSVMVPVTPELIDTLAPELGPIQFNVLRSENGNAKSVVPNVIDTQQFVSVQQIGTTRAPGSEGSESVRQADHGDRGS